MQLVKLKETTNLPKLYKNTSAYVKEVLDIGRPPLIVGLAEWTEKYRHIAAGAAMPGKWSFAPAPYLRGIMDVIDDTQYTDIVAEFSAQVAKTELIINTAGKFMHIDPSTILMVQPTQEMAKEISTSRIDGMIDDSPELRRVIGSSSVKKRAQTILHKKYKGGSMTLIGANSPNNFRSRSVRILLGDEVDAWPISLGKDGSPVTLARKRTTSFNNAKHIWTSTPTDAQTSQIHKLFLQGDQRIYEVPCTECGAFFAFEWKHMIYKDDAGEILEEPIYPCPHCDHRFIDRDKYAMLQLGQWRATAKGQKGYASFHLWQAYSTFTTWSKIAQEWREAQGEYEKLKSFVNVTLGEVWEDETDEVDLENLTVEPLDPMKLDNSYLTLFASVDVQDDRLEVMVTAWGFNENYLLKKAVLDYFLIKGDTKESEAEVWGDLHKKIGDIRYQTESGRELDVSKCGIDSGNNTDMVYDFVMKMKKATKGRYIALKGSGVMDKGICYRTSYPKKRNQKVLKAVPMVHHVGVHQAKEKLAYELQFASDRTIIADQVDTDDFRKQLTSEHKVLITSGNNIGMKRWVKKTSSSRNEVWDLMVYQEYIAQFFRRSILARKFKKAGIVSKIKPDTDGKLSEVPKPKSAPPPKKKVVKRMKPTNIATVRQRRR